MGRYSVWMAFCRAMLEVEIRTGRGPRQSPAERVWWGEEEGMERVEGPARPGAGVVGNY